MRSKLKQSFFVFLISLLLSVVVLWPIVRHPASSLYDDSDGLLGAWTIAKVQQNLLAGKSIFQGDNFFPQPNTIIFSDIFVSSAVLTLPLRVVTTEPLVHYNFVVFLGLFLTLVAAEMLIRELLILNGKGNIVLSYLGAVIFSLSQVHLHYIGHLHMFSLQYVLFGMWALVKFCNTKQPSFLYISSFFAGVQIWQSFFLVYYQIFFAFSLLFVSQARKTMVKNIKSIVLSLCILMVLSLPVVLAYAGFFRDFRVVRDIREAIHFSLIFPDLWNKFLSPVAFVLIVIGVVLGVKSKRKNALANVFMILAVFAFILSLGPALHLGSETVKLNLFGRTVHIPLPYALFYYLAPGFQAFRTPSRFIPLSLLSGIIASVMVISRKKRIIRNLVPLAIFCTGISIVASIPTRSTSVPSISSYPSYVSFLQARPEITMVKLPIRDWGDPLAKEDTYEMLYSLKTKKKLVNGQSGFFPEEWLSFQHQITINFPKEDAFILMKARGIELVLILKAHYPKLQTDSLTQMSEIIYEDAQSLVLKI